MLVSIRQQPTTSYCGRQTQYFKLVTKFAIMTLSPSYTLIERLVLTDVMAFHRLNSPRSLVFLFILFVVVLKYFKSITERHTCITKKGNNNKGFAYIQKNQDRMVGQTKRHRLCMHNPQGKKKNCHV